MIEHNENAAPETRTPPADGPDANPAQRRRRRGVLLAAVGVAAAAVGVIGACMGWTGRTKAGGADGPVFCREPVWDAGVVEQNAPASVHHAFRLENGSDETVRIDRVATDCGCVVADAPPKEVAPGAMADISVGANIVGPPGPFEKRVIVWLAPPAPQVVLTVRAQIAPSQLLYAIPSGLNFGTVEQGSGEVVRKFRVERYDGSPVRLEGVEARAGDVRLVNAVTDAADASVEVAVKLLPATLNPGLFRSVLTVKTASPSHPALDLEMFVVVTEPRRGVVGSLDIGDLRVGEERTLQLFSGGSRDARAESVGFEGEGPVAVKLGPAGTSVVVSRAAGGGEARVGRGHVLVRLPGVPTAVRVPLTVHLVGDAAKQ